MIISNFDKNLSWVKILRFKALLITIISLHMSSVMLGQVIYNVCPQGTLTNSLKGAIVDIHQKLLNSSERDYVVVLDDGIYFLDEPLVFEGNDILPDHSISFIAKDGTNPIISGGEKIINWEVDYSCISGNNILRASVNNDVRNLWINNTRMKRSQGFVGYATGTFEDTIDGIEIRGLLFPKANFPNFSDVSGLEIKYYQNWRNYFFKVTDILDNKSISTIPENQILVVIKDFNVALEMTPKMIYVGTDNPYYFENSIDLLDEPGEWCYSPKEHSIFYYAGNNENLKNINAIVPKLQNLISIKSLSLENVRKNLVFSGLEFSHTNWNRTSENGFFPKQGSTFCPTYNDRDVIPAAIVVQDAKNVKFKSCYFLHLGSNGIHH